MSNVTHASSLRQDAGVHNFANSPQSLVKHLEKLNAKWLRIYWLDFTSSSKCRLIPMKQVYETLERGKELKLSITKASLGLLANDTAIPGVTGTGVYNLCPDWSSMRAGPVADHVSCRGEFRELDNSECKLCPRTLLRRTLESAEQQGLGFLVGFEIEFVVMERTVYPNDKGEKYRTIRQDGHAWSMSRALADWGLKGSFNSVLDEIVDGLSKADIHIEQLHPEASPGQYEVVLPAKSPLEACDMLLHAREIIESTAARHGFRVTLHPKPWAEACGTASHAHMSIHSLDASGNGAVKEHNYENFYAGILKHLRAIIAFTYSNPASYERMVDGCWAGGRWVTWGTQNRETPLRKCEDSHWEFKSLDGMANPYLAMAALLAAGSHGVRAQIPLTWGDCEIDPANLTKADRERLGVKDMLPADLSEALDALSADDEFIRLLNPQIVERYIAVKMAEMKLLEPLTTEQRRQWVLERY